jgi:hypothetical protein
MKVSGKHRDTNYDVAPANKHRTLQRHVFCSLTSWISMVYFTFEVTGYFIYEVSGLPA